MTTSNTKYRLADLMEMTEYCFHIQAVLPEKGLRGDLSDTYCKKTSITGMFFSMNNSVLITVSLERLELIAKAIYLNLFPDAKLTYINTLLKSAVQQLSNCLEDYY